VKKDLGEKRVKTRHLRQEGDSLKSDETSNRRTKSTQFAVVTLKASGKEAKLTVPGVGPLSGVVIGSEEKDHKPQIIVCTKKISRKKRAEGGSTPQKITVRRSYSGRKN